MNSVESFELHYGKRILGAVDMLNKARKMVIRKELSEDKVYDAIDNIKNVYDEPVHIFIENQIFSSCLTRFQEIVQLALNVTNTYGTEMLQVLNAMEDFAQELDLLEEEEEDYEEEEA